tara:strand:- start:941 stop:1171 length:231 start_codon:yes stop_codon:yes gene_type:complete
LFKIKKITNIEIDKFKYLMLTDIFFEINRNKKITDEIIVNMFRTNVPNRMLNGIKYKNISKKNIFFDDLKFNENIY